MVNWPVVSNFLTITFHFIYNFTEFVTVYYRGFIFRQLCCSKEGPKQCNDHCYFYDSSCFLILKVASMSMKSGLFNRQILSKEYLGTVR